MTALAHEPLTADTDSAQTWVFTFGPDHRMAITYAMSGVIRGQGVSLGQRFIRLAGTREQARNEFIAMFGAVYCDQYDEVRGQVIIDRYGLTELLLEP